MAERLRAEFEWYLAHQDELVREHNGRFVVIKGERVIGSYATAIEAVRETEKTEALGTFLVQRVAPGADSHTQTFYSRVALPA